VSGLLLEIGTEEIPDWMIEPALEEFRSKFLTAFTEFGGTAVSMDATPRRLVLRAEGLAERSPDVEEVVSGPYLSAGPKAAEGFARKWNTTVEDLHKTQDAKGERYIFHQKVPGQSVRDALSAKLPAVIGGIAFPKTMSWPGSQGVRFIRPIRWIVALLDDEVLPFTFAGITASNISRGHRVLAATPFSVTIAAYEETLLRNSVVVRAEERRRRIREAIGKDVLPDGELITTLAYLTEFPSVVRGSFDATFLELPKEVLSTVMRHHQRYFSVVRGDGSLAPEFVAVSNTQGDPEGLIRRGHEKVLRARFNDARFFWASDQKRKLPERVEDLAKITFQAKLGSYLDKTQRLIQLAGKLARLAEADAAVVERAATLAKCDLTTDMVKEFTELQGVVGGLYADAQGEAPAVASAIYDQYKPSSMEDSIPRTREGQILAIADKLDTLQACFRIGMIPSGSKDPFALRRAAQGIVKILFDAKLTLRWNDLFEEGSSLADFLRERVHFYLREILGYAYDEVNAAMAAGITTLHDLAERVAAIHRSRSTKDFEPVAASFKRIQNILRQAQVDHASTVDARLLTQGPEQDLYRAGLVVREKVARSRAYGEKLEAMASLRPEVDSFFDKILVNDPDPAIRQNRLALLNSLLTEFSTIADFSEIVMQGSAGI